MNEDNNRTTRPPSNMEPDISDELMGESRSTPQDSRANIYVRSFRKLNSDPDGISVKAALDGIVERGILPDDSSKQVQSVTFETIKSAEEKTEIEINFKEIE